MGARTPNTALVTARKPYEDSPPTLSRSWRIDQVRGRRSSQEKGLAKVHEMTLKSGDGSSMNIRRTHPSDQHRLTADVIAVAKPMRFAQCAICLRPTPDSQEHLPPAALGGSVMTYTCQRCNNQFGSVLEAALID